MYRCNVCTTLCGPKKPLQVHRVTRIVPNWITGGERGEIAKEIPVCERCARELKHGTDLQRLQRRHQNIPLRLNEIKVTAPETEAVI